MKVYKAISAVQDSLAKTGISKSRKNEQQGFKFRGIDDVFNALAPALAEHGLCFLPRMTARLVEERISSNGKALFYVTVEAEFDLVSAEDGSKHTVRTYGEAMDSGDKATNKAMSAAYKYAALQTFAIPTEGDNDADAITHEVKAKSLDNIYKSMETAVSLDGLFEIYKEGVIAARNNKELLAELVKVKEVHKTRLGAKDAKTETV